MPVPARFAALALLPTLFGCDPSTTAPVDSPRVVEAPAAAERAMAVGLTHACLLNTVGAAYCWGANHRGQLGRGDRVASTGPEAVAGGLTFEGISAAGHTTCGWTSDGVAYCWGAGSHGVLGNGESADSNVPVAVAGALRFGEVRVGATSFACGRTTSGQAYCWGRNHEGQLGTGFVGGSLVPVPVATELELASISTGFIQACGLTPAGAAWCWGGGQFGALGQGWQTSPTPVRVSGGHVFVRLVTGATTTCGVTTGGETYCWGTNLHGSLGLGSVGAQASPVPVRIHGDPGFIAGGPGNEDSVLTVACGVTATGAAYCWGPNAWGALGSTAATETCGPLPTGRDTFTCTGVPVAVDGDHSFAAVFPSHGFACGVTTSGQAFCWGRNSAGELGSDAAPETCMLDSEAPCSHAPLPVAGALTARH